MASTDARESRVQTSDGPMGAGVGSPTRADIGVKTLRQDRWWLYPAATFTVFSAFIIYATVRAFMGSNFYSSPYLSPFYSPCLTDKCGEAADFGTPFGGFPLSAALIILVFPLSFRLTCYYYRKAYYRSFWLSPPACGVAEPHAKYSGETRFPLILQNIHRYAWYAAVVVAVVLTYDVFLAFGPAEGEPDGIHMGLGTVLMALHALLPLLPPHHRRPAAALQQAPGALQALDLGLQAQRPARQLRVVLAVLGRSGRPVHRAARRRRVRRSAVLLRREGEG